MRDSDDWVDMTLVYVVRGKVGGGCVVICLGDGGKKIVVVGVVCGIFL